MSRIALVILQATMLCGRGRVWARLDRGSSSATDCSSIGNREHIEPSSCAGRTRAAQGTFPNAGPRQDPRSGELFAGVLRGAAASGLLGRERRHKSAEATRRHIRSHQPDMPHVEVSRPSGIQITVVVNDAAETRARTRCKREGADNARLKTSHPDAREVRLAIPREHLQLGIEPHTMTACPTATPPSTAAFIDALKDRKDVAGKHPLAASLRPELRLWLRNRTGGTDHQEAKTTQPKYHCEKGQNSGRVDGAESYSGAACQKYPISANQLQLPRTGDDATPLAQVTFPNAGPCEGVR